jgi:hypothetical protein
MQLGPGGPALNVNCGKAIQRRKQLDRTTAAARRITRLSAPWQDSSAGAKFVPAERWTGNRATGGRKTPILVVADHTSRNSNG